jgi:hypothetical protein
MVLRLVALLVILFLGPLYAEAATYYVAKTGSGSTCSQASPCLTIATGIGKLASGDTLIVGDGTYTEQITGMPNGSAGAYTTIQAANDWGVLIDGSGFANTGLHGISLGDKSYVKVQGFRIKMSQTNANNEPVSVYESDHIKLIRCSGSYGPRDGNAATFDIGNSDYVLVEECYAYGGTRYMFIAYWTDHVIFRRCVARNDYWTGSLQSAGFCNYDSVNTIWQNCIALDSDTQYLNSGGGGYTGAWYWENKDDHAADTTSALYGNIVLNVRNCIYTAGIFSRLSGTHTIDNMVIYDGISGYLAEPGPTVESASHIAHFSNWTVGGITHAYDPYNGWGAGGTAVAQNTNAQNLHLALSDNYVKNSVLFNNQVYGVADWTTSDYNYFYGNGSAPAGGSLNTAVVGAHSVTNVNPLVNGLLYLPRIEVGSTLKTAGEGGTQVGAQILYKIGTSGTLYGETGYNTLTADPLWPFPNEAQIKSDMASYSGGGAAGARGFCTGTSKDGSAQSLTKYIWEYLGNQIPADIYGSTTGTVTGVAISPGVDMK